jgi:hypothetical protein
MTCIHLRKLEQEVIKSGIAETFRGKAWSKNCREWVYFNCCFDLESVYKRMGLDICVEKHIHLGTHDGQEAGFVCTKCNDAVMGHHPKYFSGDLYK